MTDDKNPLPDDHQPDDAKAQEGDDGLTDAEILARLEASLTGDEGIDVDDVNDSTGVNSLDDCLHDWYDLGFLPSGEGLTCAQCGDCWHLDDPIIAADALMVVWNASKTAIDATQDRVGALEKLVSTRLQVQRCEACNAWSDELVVIDDVHACVMHVGDVIADCTADAETSAIANAAEWASELDLSERIDLEGVVLWERLVSGSPGFATMIGDTGEDASLVRPVELHPLLAARLSLPTELRVGDLITRLAELLETDVPTTRQGGAFLLAMLWSAIGATDADSIETAAMEVVERSVPLYEQNRMTVAVDVCGQGMPDGTTFMASLANEVLTVVAQRAATQLLLVLHADTP